MKPKRVFLIQTDMGVPDPWDDSINISNIGGNPGLGSTIKPSAHQNNFQYFQRVDNRFAVTHSVYSEYNIVLKRPFSIHDPSTEVPINFKQIAELIDKNQWTGHSFPGNIVMMASLLEDKPLNQQDVIAKASYYCRHDEKIIDIISGEEFINPKVIPWFFCYKTDDVPLYYMVFNPHSVQCIENIEGNYNESEVFIISNHLKNLKEVVFKPKFSRNARVIGDHNIMVRGKEFTVEPFGSWFVKHHLPDFFNEAKIKVDTNFDYVWEDGKLKINTLNKQKGYLVIRWNTATAMDLIFQNSKNRFFRDYMVDVIE
jgi:hypothetical protein